MKRHLSLFRDLATLRLLHNALSALHGFRYRQTINAGVFLEKLIAVLDRVAAF